ncbi:MAG: alpha/beta hydrolase [Litoreibacter sp.]
MSRMRRLFSLLFVMVFQSAAMAETVEFQATDGVVVTAETGGASSTGTVIVLFHMAGASRGEYSGIAPRLHKLGYRTLAVDQRSGGQFGGVKNETAARVGRDPGYAAAAPDLLAAANYAREQMQATRVAVVGSSYSAALVLVLSGKDPQFADAVMAFSPGEFIAPRGSVGKSAARINVPVFLTAARNEIGQVSPIAKRIPSKAVLFKPKGAGRHGASALASKDQAEYWAALNDFLEEDVPVK